MIVAERKIFGRSRLSAMADSPPSPDLPKQPPKPPLEEASQQPPTESAVPAPAPTPPQQAPNAKPSEGSSPEPEPPQPPPTKPAELTEPSPAITGEPSIAATLDVPPLTDPLPRTDARAPGSIDPQVEPAFSSEPSEGVAGEGGGEWNLLVEKLNAWFASEDLRKQWESLRGPLRAAAILIGLVLLLRVYGSLVGTIDGIPVIGGLLELAGLIYLVRFSFKNLVRAREREQLISSWSNRWREFRGKV